MESRKVWKSQTETATRGSVTHTTFLWKKMLKFLFSRDRCRDNPFSFSLTLSLAFSHAHIISTFLYLSRILSCSLENYFSLSHQHTLSPCLSSTKKHFLSLEHTHSFPLSLSPTRTLSLSLKMSGYLSQSDQFSIIFSTSANSLHAFFKSWSNSFFSFSYRKSVPVI